MPTIDDFWLPALAAVQPQHDFRPLPGWSAHVGSNPSFVEAELDLRRGFENTDSPIWLVSASGAVGKSTLAKEVAARTGIIYVDLASSEAVGGNFLAGGLARTNLMEAWKNSTTAVLLDALDEAKMRASKDSWKGFLSDIWEMSRHRGVPTVLLGRSGIIDDVWLDLSEFGCECPILEIGYFDEARAVRFVMARLDALAEDPKFSSAAVVGGHRSVYENAARRFVEHLVSSAGVDGNHFFGYAPVLEAVATELAGQQNPAGLQKKIDEALQKRVWHGLVDSILTREAEEKVRPALRDKIPPALLTQLYGIDEQLRRLAARLFATAPAKPEVALTPTQVTDYENAIAEQLPLHPFLDGSGAKPSSLVFAASITAYALCSKDPGLRVAAESAAGSHTSNPFLLEAYLERSPETEGVRFAVPPEHVGLLYDSLRARTRAGEITRLTIDADEGEEDAEVEMEIFQLDGGGSRTTEFRTFQAGTLRFFRSVSGVRVDAPNLDVEISGTTDVELFAPILLNVSGLSFNCPELICTRSDLPNITTEDPSIFLEATKLIRSVVERLPTIRHNIEFGVSWPGANIFPWYAFATPAPEYYEPKVYDGLLALRRFVVAFQKRGNVDLSRYRRKIDHPRMMKGFGRAILEQLMNDDIVWLDGNFYKLDPDKLGALVGATYQDLKFKRFGDRIWGYVDKIVS